MATNYDFSPELPTPAQIARHKEILAVLDGYGQGTSTMAQLNALPQEEVRAARAWRNEISMAQLEVDIPDFYEGQERGSLPAKLLPATHSVASTKGTPKTDLLRRGLGHLAEHFDATLTMRAEVLLGGDYTRYEEDGYLRIGNGTVPFRVMLSGGIEEIRNAVDWIDEPRMVYIVPKLDRAARAACKQQQINYLDGVGNCRIVLDHFVVLVECD